MTKEKLNEHQIDREIRKDIDRKVENDKFDQNKVFPPPGEES